MNMKIRNIIGLLIISSVLIWNTGCKKHPYLDGNNNVIMETRIPVSFNRIENEDDFEVYYYQDTMFRIIIRAESNLVPYIRTVVNGNTLIIDTRENLNNNVPMEVHVYSPTLVGVELSGSGYIHLNTTVSERFTAKLSGSGHIEGIVVSDYFEAILSGSGYINFMVESKETKGIVSGSGGIQLLGLGDWIYAEFADFVITGSGDIEAYNLPVITCHANISGSGDIFTLVRDNLVGRISGSGNVYYKGNPNIDSDITGSGNIIHEE